MKKYVIMYADGRQQTIMQSVHESRKEAEEALLIYLCDHNEKCDDSSYLSPFDFTVEEVDVKDVNEVITDFESAKSAIIRVSPADFIFSGNIKRLEDIARLVSEINPKHIEALIALNELFTIAEAWNKEDEFVPDFSDWNQDKWFPWFKYDEDVAGFVYASTASTPADAYPPFGSLLCFKTSERAAQFGKQFVDLYNEVFL